MRHKYNPRDIAIYLNYADLQVKQEQFIMDWLWLNREAELDQHHQYIDRRFFQRKIEEEIYILTGYLDSREAISQALHAERNHIILKEESDWLDSDPYITWYMKKIRLELTLHESKVKNRRKISTILKDLGYSERVKKLVDEVDDALKETGLEMFINKQVMSFKEGKLDDYVFIRIRKD